jgi:hypothetical protein
MFCRARAMLCAEPAGMSAGSAVQELRFGNYKCGLASAAEQQATLKNQCSPPLLLLLLLLLLPSPGGCRTS